MFYFCARCSNAPGVYLVCVAHFRPQSHECACVLGLRFDYCYRHSLVSSHSLRCFFFFKKGKTNTRTHAFERALVLDDSGAYVHVDLGENTPEYLPSVDSGWFLYILSLNVIECGRSKKCGACPYRMQKHNKQRNTPKTVRMEVEALRSRIAHSDTAPPSAA